MKSVIKYLFSLIMMILLAGCDVEATTPCSKGLFKAICNPKLKLVEQCYECHRLDNGKERCFPAVKKFDITDFLSDEKWDCEAYEWKNPFQSGN